MTNEQNPAFKPIDSTHSADDRDDATQPAKPTSKRPDVRYRVYRSKDGVDDTFEVYSRLNGWRIAWTSYWRWDMPLECERRAKRNARTFGRLLELIANDAISIDLELLIEELKHIASGWGFPELRQARPDWSDGKVWNWVSEYRYYHGNDIGYPADIVEDVNRLDQ